MKADFNENITKLLNYTVPPPMLILIWKILSRGVDAGAWDAG